MLRTTILNLIALAAAVFAVSLAGSSRIAQMYGWLEIDREQLAGFGLILVYWCTLVLAHYYYETRVMRDRVRAEICISRQRTTALWHERSRLGAEHRANGNGATNGSQTRGPGRASASAGGAATALVVEAEPRGRSSAGRPADAMSRMEDPIVRLLDQAGTFLGETGHCWRRGFMTFLGWESAPELSALQLLNAADVLAWGQVSDETAVCARIVQAQSQIGELAPDQQHVWRSQFGCFWRSDGRPTPLDPALPGRRRAAKAVGRVAAEDDRALALWRARLCAFLADLYESRQVRNARLSSLQQKASWSVLISLWVLIALAAAGDGRVLLAGAIGGLLSRLTRFTGIRWLTTDFGLGWAQLYLAPPVGALAAWGGIHTLLLIQHLGTIDLHTVLSDTHAQGTGSNAASVLGLAIALGFSERLFDRLLRRAADTIVPPAEASQPSSAPAGVRAL
jgi:hypothetical protein